MKKLLLALWAILLTGAAGIAQTIDTAKLNAYFDALEKGDRFMGSVAVAQNGKTLYTRAVGYADIAQGIKSGTGTKYRIGSISKTFTATLVFMAIEEGKLSLDQPIGLYFPAQPDGEKITIGQMLCHRSGIHNFTDESYDQWRTQYKTKEELAEMIADGGLDFEPGTNTSYSNSNYLLLSFILEAVYQKSYDRLLKEKIAGPIGLTDTYVGEKTAIEKGECYSYRYANGWQPMEETAPLFSGAGGIVSTPTDLTKFNEALFNGKLVSDSSLRQMETTQNGIGMGLTQIPFYEKSAFGHGGLIDGYVSISAYFPADGLSYACTGNGVNYTFNDISIAILSAVYDKPFQIPTFETYAATPEELEQYPGVYSSKQLPLKITVFIHDGTLMAQATGQTAFPLEATAADRFRFDPGKIAIDFSPAYNTMILKQGGVQFLFTKDE